jgi:hypothetical protein
MLVPGQVPNPGLMLKSFLNKLDLTNLPKEFDKIKLDLPEAQSEVSSCVKRRKISEGEEPGSPMIICIKL